MAAMSRLLLFILAAIPLTIYLTDDFIPSCFVFQPSRLQEICKKHIAAHSDNIKPLMKNLVLDLQKEYGPIVEDYDDARWVFNVAGGSTGSMMVLHASITEYLILFGSAAGTEGHSGAHLAHDYFTIIAGRQTAGFLGEVNPRVYYPGDQHHHPRFTPAHYTLDNSTWALELAQGIIPAMLPFGLVQMPMTFDLSSTWRTIWYTGKSTVVNLMRGKI